MVTFSFRPTLKSSEGVGQGSLEQNGCNSRGRGAHKAFFCVLTAYYYELEESVDKQDSCLFLN